VDFPYVLVRLPCDTCKRAGSYRLARLAVKYGAEILLDDLLVRLSADCPWRDDRRGSCGARFADMPPRRPPDLPAALMRSKQSHSMRTKRRPIAIMRRSCSDSLLIASQMD
jgi:hypothetical protein